MPQRKRERSCARSSLSTIGSKGETRVDCRHSFPGLTAGGWSFSEQLRQLGYELTRPIKRFHECLPVFWRGNEFPLIGQDVLSLQAGAIQYELCDCYSGRFRASANQPFLGNAGTKIYAARSAISSTRGMHVSLQDICTYIVRRFYLDDQRIKLAHLDYSGLRREWRSMPSCWHFL